MLAVLVCLVVLVLSGGSNIGLSSPVSLGDHSGASSRASSWLDDIDEDYTYWSPSLDSDIPPPPAYPPPPPPLVVPIIADSLISQIGSDAEMKLRSQISADRRNIEYTPDMTVYHSTTLLEITPVGYITLGSPIYRGSQSIVFSINEFPDLVVKYQVQCDNFDTELHPLLRDAWYTEEAHAFGLAPHVVFLSPPAGLCPTKQGKCEFFKILEEEFTTCRRNNGVVRYMISTRSNATTLHVLRTSPFYGNRSGAMNLHNAVRIGLGLIHTLARLHVEAKIVHGDIHTSNVLLDMDAGTLVLLDFGRAFRNIQTHPDTPMRARGDWFDYMNTQWQIDGFAWAARDDLNKAIQLIAHLMNPFTYHDLEKRFEKQGYTALKLWKERSDWFVTGLHDPIDTLGVPAVNKEAIHRSLENILRIVRRLPINGPLPYQALATELSACIELSKSRGSFASTTTTMTPNITTTTIA